MVKGRLSHKVRMYNQSAKRSIAALGQSYMKWENGKKREHALTIGMQGMFS